MKAGMHLYEQGLPIEEYGLAEWQICFFRNSRISIQACGRTMLAGVVGFWKPHYEKLQDVFPGNLKECQFG